MPDNWIIETEIDKGYAFRYCDCCRRLIRNTVVMRNKDNGDCLVVGKECVRRLETDLLPKAKTDQAVSKRKERERNFLKQKWEKNEKGNFVYRNKKELYTIICKEDGCFGVVNDGVWIWKYAGKNIRTLQTAKKAAFLLADKGELNYPTK